MAKRRRLRGKRLLVASVSLGASSLLSSCGDAVANLIAPPEDAMVEEDAGGGADAGGGMDAGGTMDAGNADAGDSTDAGGATDAGGGPTDSSIIFFPDAPIANLVAPPDGFSF